MPFALASGWIIGWIVGAVIVLVAASLLVVIIAYGRKITSQGEDITAALDGARQNTDALFDVTRTNFAIDRITRGLRSVRTGEQR
jgi:hypothetical protein